MAGARTPVSTEGLCLWADWAPYTLTTAQAHIPTLQNLDTVQEKHNHRWEQPTELPMDTVMGGGDVVNEGVSQSKENPGRP